MRNLRKLCKHIKVTELKEKRAFHEQTNPHEVTAYPVNVCWLVETTTNMLYRICLKDKWFRKLYQPNL